MRDEQITTNMTRQGFLRVCGLTVLTLGLAQWVNPMKALEKPEETAKFTSVWKCTLPAGTLRAVVADIMGDKKPRLLTLGSDNILTVHKMVEGKPEKEATISLGKGGEKFVVGEFSKGKPAIIVAPEGTYFWDKDKFAQKAGFKTDAMLLLARLLDGSQAFYTLNPMEPPHGYSVDLTAENIFKPAADLAQITANDSGLLEMTLNPPAEFWDNLPFPNEIKKGGMARLFSPKRDGNLLGLFVWKEAESSSLVILKGDDLFPEPNSGAKPIWQSPKLSGGVLSLEFGADVMGGKQSGIYVLVETGEGKKERVLEFFTLQ